MEFQSEERKKEYLSTENIRDHESPKSISKISKDGSKGSKKNLKSDVNDWIQIISSGGLSMPLENKSNLLAAKTVKTFRSSHHV